LARSAFVAAATPDQVARYGELLYVQGVVLRGPHEVRDVRRYVAWGCFGEQLNVQGWFFVGMTRFVTCAGALWLEAADAAEVIAMSTPNLAPMSAAWR